MFRKAAIGNRTHEHTTFMSFLFSIFRVVLKYRHKIHGDKCFTFINQQSKQNNNNNNNENKKRDDENETEKKNSKGIKRKSTLSIAYA